MSRRRKCSKSPNIQLSLDELQYFMKSFSTPPTNVSHVVYPPIVSHSSTHPPSPLPCSPIPSPSLPCSPSLSPSLSPIPSSSSSPSFEKSPEYKEFQEWKKKKADWNPDKYQKQLEQVQQDIREMKNISPFLKQSFERLTNKLHNTTAQIVETMQKQQTQKYVQHIQKLTDTYNKKLKRMQQELAEYKKRHEKNEHDVQQQVEAWVEKMTRQTVSELEEVKAKLETKQVMMRTNESTKNTSQVDCETEQLFQIWKQLRHTE